MIYNFVHHNTNKSTHISICKKYFLISDPYLDRIIYLHKVLTNMGLCKPEDELLTRTGHCVANIEEKLVYSSISILTRKDVIGTIFYPDRFLSKNQTPKSSNIWTTSPAISYTFSSTAATGNLYAQY